MIGLAILALVIFAADAHAAEEKLTTTGALVWGAVGTVVVGIVGGAGALFMSLLTGGKKMVDRIDELNTRQWKLQDELTLTKTELGQCKAEHAQDKVEKVQLKADLERTQLRVANLETATGTAPTTVNIPGVIVADKAGIIQVFSPSLTMWLGWTPDEMYGRSIETLVPPEHLEAHRAGFGRGTPVGAVLDPTKKIHTFVLDKTGKRVSVTISVRKWPGPDGHFTATLQQRSSTMGGTVPPGTPNRRAGDV